MEDLGIKRRFSPKDIGLKLEARLHMIKDNLGLRGDGPDDKPRVHHKQHIEIIRDLFTGDKTAPQKHPGQEAAQLLAQLLPACGRGGESGEDLVRCGHVQPCW